MIIVLFFILSFPVSSQVSFNIDSVGRWWDDNIPFDKNFNTYNEVWGFSWKGLEYAVIGSKGGTYIIHVTFPETPELVEFIPGKFGSAINRDYKDYNGFLYLVCDQGASSLQIVDYRGLPESISLVYDSDSMFTNCHNLFIDTNTARLYACDVRTLDNKDIDLEIYSLKESYIPKRMLRYNREDVNAFHDIFVRNDTAYGNNGNTGLFIYDFSDTTNPKILGSLVQYPEKGFNHSGYPDEEGNYYYMGDETVGRDLKVVDVRDVTQPVVVDLFNAQWNEDKILAHNQLVKGDLLFVSYYEEGLQLYDISIRHAPKKVGHYQTYTETYIDSFGVERKDYSKSGGAWGVYPYLPSGNILVSDRGKGLFILKLGDLSKPKPPRIPPPKYPHRGLYPNPAEEFVDLIYPANRIVSVRLIDLLGRTVEENLEFYKYHRNTRINFSRRHKFGVYLLEVQTLSEVFITEMYLH